MSKTLLELQDIQRSFDLSHQSANGPLFIEIGDNNVQELEHLAVCLAGEVGEFCNILKKVRRGDTSLKNAKPALSEELADIFIYLIKISNQFGIELEKEMMSKVEKNKARFQDSDD